MANFAYTAKRKLTSGTTYGDAKSIDIDLQRWDPTTEPVKDSLTALSGKRTATLHRLEVLHEVQSDYIESADKAKWDEFAASVAAGETFTFDALGTDASPDSPVSVTLEGSLQLQRISPTLDTWTANFVMVEAV